MAMNPFFSSLLAGLGTGVGGGILDKVFPQPDPLSGKQEGQKQLDYFDTLYKGKLNPWELSGAGGQGVGGTAAPLAGAIGQRKTAMMQKNREIAMQTQQLQTQENVAKIGADAQVESAKISAGPAGQTAPSQKLKIDQEIINLKETLKKITQETRLTKNKADATRTISSLSDEIQAILDNSSGKQKTVFNNIQKQIQKIDNPQKIKSLANDILNWISGSGDDKIKKKEKAEEEHRIRLQMQNKKYQTSAPLN